MKGKSLLVFSGALLLAGAMLSCGGGSSSTSETPAATAPAGGGKTVDASTAGTITGTIKLDGAAPKPKTINMAAEPACAKEHSTPAQTEDVVAGDNGTLQNVVVYLKGDFSAYTFTTPTEPAVMDQKGCQYHPHVLALMTNQPLSVTNSDMTTHNIHPVPMNNKEWNQSQPPGAAPLMQSFARTEVAIPVKCNVHPWMKSYMAVLDNPYFQVTGKDGSFEIKNVPPGTYDVTAWQESLGTQDTMVTLGPKDSKAVTLTFKAAGSGN